MRDVIPEVVGKFIERGDLDFHPQREVISWTENMTATRKKISLAAPKETTAAGKVTPDSADRPELGAVKATKAPEGATTGAVTGGAIGGTVGLLAGVGAIPHAVYYRQQIDTRDNSMRDLPRSPPMPGGVLAVARLEGYRSRGRAAQWSALFHGFHDTLGRERSTIRI